MLPSFTEGHPMVLLEALARMRPVVIFKEINHVIGKKKGIFVSDRNYESFLITINHIKNNYQSIQEEMKQNKLPTHEEFVKKLDMQREFEINVKLIKKASDIDSAGTKLMSLPT